MTRAVFDAVWNSVSVAVGLIVFIWANVKTIADTILIIISCRAVAGWINESVTATASSTWLANPFIWIFIIAILVVIGKTSNCCI